MFTSRSNPRIDHWLSYSMPIWKVLGAAVGRLSNRNYPTCAVWAKKVTLGCLKEVLTWLEKRPQTNNFFLLLSLSIFSHFWTEPAESCRSIFALPPLINDVEIYICSTVAPERVDPQETSHHQIWIIAMTLLNDEHTYFDFSFHIVEMRENDSISSSWLKTTEWKGDKNPLTWHLPATPV